MEKWKEILKTVNEISRENVEAMLRLLNPKTIELSWQKAYVILYEGGRSEYISLVEEINELKLKAIFALAVDHVDMFSERIIKIMKLSRDVNGNNGYNFLVKVSKKGNDPIIYLGGEDHSDYDPGYIDRIKRDAKAFCEIVDMEEIVLTELLSHDKALESGPHHVIFINDLVEKIKLVLGDKAKEVENRFDALFNEYEEKVRIAHENALKFQRNNSIERIKNSLVQIGGLDKSQLDFAATALHDQKIQPEKIKKNGRFIVAAKSGFGTTVSGMSVIDDATRQIIVIDLEKMTCYKSDKEAKPWRRTETGVIGDIYETEISKIMVEDENIHVFFINGDERTIKIN